MSNTYTKTSLRELAEKWRGYSAEPWCPEAGSEALRFCAKELDAALAAPPAASGDDLIARLRIIATDYEPGSILRNTLDEAIRRLAAVAQAGNALLPPPAEGEAA